MNKNKIEKKPERLFYWKDKTKGVYYYQVNYNIGFCKVEVTESLEYIKELGEKLGIKAEKIEED